MRCVKCKLGMKKVMVNVYQADSPVTSYQCPKCSYFDFEEKSMNKAINEIRVKESVLKIKRK